MATVKIPTDYRTTNPAYHMRELDEVCKRLADVDRQSRAEREEARANFAQACAENPKLVHDRVGWLLDGSYGYGAYYLAWQIATGSKRNNKPAQMCQLIAALEWYCTGADCRKVYKALAPETQAKLTAAIDTAISEALTEAAEGEAA